MIMTVRILKVQTEITPYMRMMVIDWMFDVSQDLQCRGHEDMFLLSCNVMDSFLSRVDITRTSFQVTSCDHHSYQYGCLHRSMTFTSASRETLFVPSKL